MAKEPLEIDATKAIKPTNPQQLDSGAQITVTKDNFDKLFKDTGVSLSQNLAQKNGTAVNTFNSANNKNSFKSKLDSLEIDWSPETNPLNKYANYTYHIRWFVTSEFEAYNRIDVTNPNSSQMTHTIIAESGVTVGFNIEELRIDASTTGNMQKRNMWTTAEFTLIINEPQGLSLMDKIYYSSQEIGVANHMRCPYFLETWFQGYNEDGTIASNQMYYSINRVIITEIVANATQVGTKYTIKGYCDGSVAEMNQVSTIPAAVKITASTVGQFFKGLEVAWNKLQKDKNHDDLQQMTYKIEYPPLWENWNLKNTDVSKQNARNTDMKAAIDGNITSINIPAGQSIERIVDFVLYASLDAQKWIVGDTIGGGQATMSDHAMIRFATVYPKTKIIGFNPVTQDYLREITYVLVPTESVRAFTDLAAVKRLQAPTTQLGKLRYILEQKRLKKKYDYIYTGLNTEVLRFEIKIDNYWAVQVPNFNQLGSYDQNTQGGVVDQNSVGYQAHRGTLKNKDEAIQNRIKDIDKLQSTAQNSAVADSLAEEKNKLQSQLANQSAKPNAPTDKGPSTSAKQSVLYGNDPGSVTVNAAALKDPNTAQLLRQQLNYNTNRGASLKSAYVEDATFNPALQIRPLPLVGSYDPKPTQQNAGLNADRNKISASTDTDGITLGTGFVGAVFGNLFETQGGAFNVIEIEIRGDPWWLPQGNLLKDRRASELTGTGTGSTPANTGGVADFLAGDNSFILEMRAGVVYSEETGYVDQGLSGDFFNGLYNITKIENIFNRGKFTQILHANKDLLSQSPVENPSDKKFDKP